MAGRHTTMEKYSLMEHAQLRRTLHHRVLLEHERQGHIILPENFAGDTDWPLDEYYFLQPVPTRQRRAMLHEAGISRIDPSEREECRSLRASRGLCGCACREACRPPSCACIRSNISCQVDQMAFPCACTRAGCANPHGRVEFNAARVRAHFIRTLLQLGLEQNAAAVDCSDVGPSPPAAKRCHFDNDDGAASSSTNGLEHPPAMYFDSLDRSQCPTDAMMVGYEDEYEEDDGTSETSSDSAASGEFSEFTNASVAFDAQQRTLDNYVIRFSQQHSTAHHCSSTPNFAPASHVSLSAAQNCLSTPVSCATSRSNVFASSYAAQTVAGDVPCSRFMPRDNVSGYCLPLKAMDDVLQRHLSTEGIGAESHSSDCSLGDGVGPDGDRCSGTVGRGDVGWSCSQTCRPDTLHNYCLPPHSVTLSHREISAVHRRDSFASDGINVAASCVEVSSGVSEMRQREEICDARHMSDCLAQNDCVISLSNSSSEETCEAEVLNDGLVQSDGVNVPVVSCREEVCETEPVNDSCVQHNCTSGLSQECTVSCEEVCPTAARDCAEVSFDSDSDQHCAEVSVSDPSLQHCAEVSVSDPSLQHCAEVSVDSDSDLHCAEVSVSDPSLRHCAAALHTRTLIESCTALDTPSADLSSEASRVTTFCEQTVTETSAVPSSELTFPHSDRQRHTTVTGEQTRQAETVACDISALNDCPAAARSPSCDPSFPVPVVSDVLTDTNAGDAAKIVEQIIVPIDSLCDHVPLQHAVITSCDEISSTEIAAVVSVTDSGVVSVAPPGDCTGS